MTSQKTKQAGFTIVELLIVIIVIGILATIAFVSYGNVTRKARDSERVADAKAIASKAEEYYATNGSYPDATTLAGLSGLNAESKKSPNGGAVVTTVPTFGTTANDQYAYVVTGSPGTSFVITYWDEVAGGTASKTVTSSN